MAVKSKQKAAVATAIPVTGVRGKRVSVQGIEAKVEDIVLHSEAKAGAKLNVELGGGIVGAELSRTIEGASTLTLTVYDPKQKILQAAIMRRRFNCRIGPHLWFTLVGVKKQGKTVVLTFEDREVSWLRELKGPKKAYRDQVTRAEFFLMLLKDVKKGKGKIEFYCPQLHKKQDIKSDKDLKQESSNKNPEDNKKQSERQPGLGQNDLDEVTFKGVKANIGQIHISDIVLDTGMSMGVSFKLLVCSIMTITQESNATDLAIASGPNGEGYGPFSQTAAWRSAGYPGGVHGDVAECARGFFQVAKKVEKSNPNMAKGPLCQEVQHAGAGELYSQWEDEATKTVEAYLGGASPGSEFSSEVTKRYPFQVDKNQDYWDWMGEAAEEVQWRRFMVAGKLYYISEPDLLKSQVRMLVTPQSQGVENVDFDYTMGKKVIEATITCWAKDWSAPPGTVVKFKGYGPLDGKKKEKFKGRFIVATINSDLFTDYVTVTVKKAMRPLPEPAPETETRTQQVPGGAGGASTDDLENVNIPNSSPGPPAWGGAKAVFMQFVHPFMEQHGLQPGSEKEQGHSPTGDHDPEGQPSGYATDYPTYNGEKIARALAEAMGNNHWSANSYDSFIITVDGFKFQVQILWGSGIEHGDHVHVGMHRV